MPRLGADRSRRLSDLWVRGGERAGCCSFTFENGCESTTRYITGRHAAKRGHTAVYGSYDERERPFHPIEDAREGDDALSQAASFFTP